MSLLLKLNEITEENQAADRLLLSDTTLYEDGEYARDTRANFIVTEYKGTKSTSSVSTEDYDPLTVESFRVKANSDGWYRAYLVSVPVINSEDELTEGQIAYSIQEQAILQMLNSEVTTITAKSLVGNGLYASDASDYLFIPNNSKMFNLLNRQVITLRKLDVNGTNARQISRVNDILQTVDGVLAGAIYEFAKGDKLNAQEDIEFLNSNVDKYIVH
jgi:hypothetical protein